jgi:hypothetical protein
MLLSIMLTGFHVIVSFEFVMVFGAGKASHHSASAYFCTISFRHRLFIDFFDAHIFLNENWMSMKILLSPQNRDFPGYRASKTSIRKAQCSLDFSHLPTNLTAHHEPLACDHLLFGPQRPA